MNEKPKPVRLNTHGAARPNFETYKEPFEADLQDEDYEDLRVEIATYYSVPPKHRVIIRDQQLEKTQRTQRAFSVLVLDTGERYYVDGRVPHATLLRYLKNKFQLSIDIEEGTGFSSVHGFMDPDGFPHVPLVQEAAQKAEKTITWFVRYTTSSPGTHAQIIPPSPVELS